MFQLFKGASDDIAFEKGADVDIRMSNMLRIQEAEGLDLHRDLQGLFYIVRHHLEDWCRHNIKCKWRASREIIYPPDENTEEIIRFQFSSKKEAMRFKLTWGGK